jgi:catechol 2,3-dioxygenase-like lactoylglutathione lyase family enzyme
MEIIKLCWVGTRTVNAEPTVAFFRDVLGLRPEPLGADSGWPRFQMAARSRPSAQAASTTGTSTPVRSPASSSTTSPTATATATATATEELRAAGVEILLEADVDEWGDAWVHFRAPDGNIYEFAQDPGVRSGSPGRVAG